MTLQRVILLSLLLSTLEILLPNLLGGLATATIVTADVCFAVYCIVVAKRQKRLATEGDDPVLLQGVSGWLLFFILHTAFYRTYLIPIVVQTMMAEQPPGVFFFRINLLPFFLIGESLLVLYGLVRLYRVTPGAVQLNQIILSVCIALSILKLLAMVAIRSMPEYEYLGRTELTRGIGEQAFIIIEYISWIVYLTRSRRVKNTWAFENALPAEPQEESPESRS